MRNIWHSYRTRSLCGDVTFAHIAHDVLYQGNERVFLFKDPEGQVYTPSSALDSGLGHRVFIIRLTKAAH